MNESSLSEILINATQDDFIQNNPTGEGELHYTVLTDSTEGLNGKVSVENTHQFELLPKGNLEIPAVVTNGDFTYTVTEISADAFKNCNGLTKVTIPNTVVLIGDAAFENCTSVENIILSDSLTKIPTTIFKNCNKLTNIIIPDSVKIISGQSFEACDSLVNVTFGKM